MKTKRYMTLGFVGVSLLLASCKPAGQESKNEGSSLTVVEGAVLASGNFKGLNDHVVTGRVEIVEADGGFVVNLGADFSLDGAPDPKVGLGKDGYEAKTKAGDLLSKEGASSYTLPEGVDPKAYNEVYIWCEKFGVPLGVAKLTSN